MNLYDRIEERQLELHKDMKNPKTGIGDKYKALAKMIEMQIILHQLET